MAKLLPTVTRLSTIIVVALVAGRGLDAPLIDPNGPSLFTALQEQLGLKLGPTRAPVNVLIDRAEQPTDD